MNENFSERKRIEHFMYGTNCMLLYGDNGFVQCNIRCSLYLTEYKKTHFYQHFYIYMYRRPNVSLNILENIDTAWIENCLSCYCNVSHSNKIFPKRWNFLEQLWQQWIIEFMEFYLMTIKGDVRSSCTFEYKNVNISWTCSFLPKLLPKGTEVR